jgi:hypothetical protein
MARHRNQLPVLLQAGDTWVQAMKKSEILAFDRASVRSVDEDGRLRVEITNISKAAVNPYYGREIPEWKSLGLNPDKVYQLLRDPQELEKSVATFNGLPLLNKHVPFSVDTYDPEDVVGATGTDAQFVAPFLKNSLVVWDDLAIAGIDSEDQCELSCAYRYDADMTPGVFENTPYDGVMRNIRGNHIALVEKGRAGPDVVVGDSDPFSTLEYQPMKASRKSIAVKAAIGAYLRPMLAQDAAIGDLGALVRGVKAATIAQDTARIVSAVEKSTKGKLAQDVELDTTELAEIIEAAAAAEPEEVAEDEDDDKQREGESDEDYKARMDAKKKDDPDPAQDEDDDDDKKDDKDVTAAMDAAIKAAEKRTEAATVARMNAIRQAEKEVAPLIGEVMAQDSAAAVYKLALDHAGVDTKGVHPSAYGAMVRMLSAAKAQRPANTALAMDSAVNDSFAERFPTAGKLIRS